MADCALRQLQLIEMLACNRYGATLDTFQDNTRNLGIEVSDRTLQRDLKEIADILPVDYRQSSGEGDKGRWQLLLQLAANEHHYHPRHDHRFAG